MISWVIPPNKECMVSLPGQGPIQQGYAYQKVKKYVTKENYYISAPRTPKIHRRSADRELNPARLKNNSQPTYKNCSYLFAPIL